MVREIVTICVGQGGCQLGNSVWKQYTTEHHVQPDGKRCPTAEAEDNKFETFFEHTSSEQFVPRNMSIDLEPTVINEIRRGPYSNLFHPECLISGKEDAANNFARGHYTIGRENMDRVEEQLRKMVENCENCQGFMVPHSVGGGTGSGMGMLILEKCAVDYRKRAKIGFEIYPSENISTCIVSPYNGMLATHWLIDHTDVSLIFDNEALYRICQNNLAIKRPSYRNLNGIISKVLSSMTAALRFTGELNMDMNEFQTNLVPFPRLHFMTTSLAPVVNKQKASREVFDVRSITDNALNSSHFLTDIPDFDVVEDKYMAISLNYRGAVGSKDANQTLTWVKSQGKVSFVDWCPTGFKLGLNDIPAAEVENDDLAPASRNCVMIGNNIGIHRVFRNRLIRKADMMYSQRAYVHWYVGEGMEEGEFSEAREDIGFLEKDYFDVLEPEHTDDDPSHEY